MHRFGSDLVLPVIISTLLVFQRDTLCRRVEGVSLARQNPMV